MPRKQFQKLAGMTIAGRTVPQNGAPRRACPGCGGPMADIEVKGAEVDFCPACDAIVSGRASLSLLEEVSRGDPAPGRTLRELDSSRNLGTASRPVTVERLQVESLFVLYRNGLLLSSYTPKIPVEIDREVLGSMLMAITESVRTSLGDAAGGRPLTSIRFGDREIAFEHGEYLVAAVAMRGMLDPKIRAKLGTALREVEAQNDPILRSWDGNLATFSKPDGIFEPLVRQVRAGG